MNLLTDLLAVEKTVTTSPLDTKAVWAAVRSLGDDVFGGTVTPLTMQAQGGTHGDDVKACVERIKAACCQTRVGEGTLGDGKILQALMQLLPIILSLFGVTA